MDRPLRMILIGVGAMGRAWLDVLRADPRWNIAALVDTAPARLAEVAAAYGVPSDACFGDARAPWKMLPPMR
ncbi:MAG: Gfo/Idh/MocA family oxidoreductase [Oscillochloris sp.]|nr:Gfo/Idh/MocA family oxidoreductase [Oscillochloris sp.]